MGPVVSDNLEHHVVDCSTGEETRKPFTKRDYAQRRRDEKLTERIRAEREAAQAQLDADVEAVRAGTADDETRNRLLLALISNQ